MHIKLDTRDKVALVWAGVIIYSVWIIPTAVAGWVAWLYRDKLKTVYQNVTSESTINKVKSFFK